MLTYNSNNGQNVKLNTAMLTYNSNNGQNVKLNTAMLTYNINNGQNVKFHKVQNKKACTSPLAVLRSNLEVSVK
jgi:hypothetical protein